MRSSCQLLLRQICNMPVQTGKEMVGGGLTKNGAAAKITGCHWLNY